MNILQKVGKLATSPKAYLVYGLVALGVGAYETIKASREVDDILDEAQKEIAEIKSVNDNTELKEKIPTKDLGEVYFKHGVKVVKLYAPAVICDAVGVACIFRSHTKLTKETKDLKLALAGVAKGYSALTNRIKDTIGDEEGGEFINGFLDKTETVDCGDGKTKEVTTKNIVVDEFISPYARFFDELCAPYYKGVPEDDLSFLLAVQADANKKLKRRGYLFLNDVYAMLGLDESHAGNYIGWTYKKDGGENQIDFDIFNTRREANRRFVNGVEPVILLDFNVDGDIIDRI